MNVVDQATQTQLNNIQARTGKTLDELFALIRASGLAKHGEIREMLKRDLGMGHGDANALAGAFLKSDGQGAAPAGEADDGRRRRCDLQRCEGRSCGRSTTS